jgi:stage V sporulation protein B
MKAVSSPQSEGVPAHAKMKADSSLAGRRATVSTLLKLSLPVTGSRLIGSFSHWLESLVIVRSLAVAGVSVGAATAQYGLLAGMVIPTLLMPGAITFSLAVSLVPALAEAAARGDQATIRKRMGQSIRVSLITGGPFAVVMFVLAEPLCRLLYANVEAAPMLQLMSVVSLFLYVQTPLQSALQALDRPMSALLNSLAGAIVKLTLIYYLITRLSLGITGAAIAISVYITFVTILHWRSVTSITQLKFPLADLLKLTFGMGAMGITCHTAYQLTPFNELFRFLTSITSGTVVFLIIMLATKMLDRNDITRFFPSRR